MSLRWVESIAPLLDEECVMAALESLRAAYQVMGSRIEIAIADGPVILERRHQAYVVRRRADLPHVQWERRLLSAYAAERIAKLARMKEAARREEEQRREEERKRLVEARRSAIVEQAKKMGYSIQEERRGEEIQLVLVRRTY